MAPRRLRTLVARRPIHTRRKGWRLQQAEKTSWVSPLISYAHTPKGALPTTTLKRVADVLDSPPRCWIHVAVLIILNLSNTLLQAARPMRIGISLKVAAGPICIISFAAAGCTVTSERASDMTVRQLCVSHLSPFSNPTTQRITRDELMRRNIDIPTTCPAYSQANWQMMQHGVNMMQGRPDPGGYSQSSTSTGPTNCQSTPNGWICTYPNGTQATCYETPSGAYCDLPSGGRIHCFDEPSGWRCQ